MKNLKWVAVLGMFLLAGCASAKKQATVAEPAASTSKAAAASAAPATPAVPGASELTCVKGKDSRMLEVAKSGAGCSLDYTKQGKKSAVATSSKGLKHCVATQKKIRTKLESAGYKCT